VNRCIIFTPLLAITLCLPAPVQDKGKEDTAKQKTSIKLRIEQLTSGTKHHFFGYIGQCQTIPWNANGRYVLGLEIDRIDRLPTPREAATVFVIDTQKDNRILRLDKTHAWNPQQGTMFYWHPLEAETQFFLTTGMLGPERYLPSCTTWKRKSACVSTSMATHPSAMAALPRMAPSFLA
jgi:hypothetical protein